MSIPEFSLRFPLTDAAKWAADYMYQDDSEVSAIGARVRERGWYLGAEMRAVALWKTRRSRSRVSRNTAAAVPDATALALSTSDERLRVGALTLLQGVEMPTASVLLHLAHREPYPILDFRALWSLGVTEPPSYYSFEFWQAYVVKCRQLAKSAGVSMRTLDRALWQYSAMHQRDESTHSPDSTPRTATTTAAAKSSRVTPASLAPG